MDRPAKLDQEHWQPDRVVFFKRPAHRAMIAAMIANKIIEKMIATETRQLPASKNRKI